MAATSSGSRSEPLPTQITGDARGEITERTWADIKEAVADRVRVKLAEYAPGIEAA